MPSPGPRTYTLDSNAVDWIIDNAAYDRVLNAVTAGRVELRYTPVQVQELASIDDLHRRVGRLLVLIRLGRLVNSRVLALDFGSYVDFVEISDDSAAFHAVAGENLSHGMDAVIASGSGQDGPIITCDKRLISRGKSEGFDTIHPSDFVASLPEVEP